MAEENNKSGKKILIVDDEESLRNALIEKLKQESFDTKGAKDGEEALKIALDWHPDLILLDIMMPKRDGISMLKDLKKDEWGKDVPVILLTNLSDPVVVAEATEVGHENTNSQDYLVKSEWKLEDVVKKIKEKLKI